MKMKCFRHGTGSVGITLLLGFAIVLFAGCSNFKDRVSQEEEYRRFAKLDPIAHQEFTRDFYLNILDAIACEKYNFSHRYLRAMVTESENHRLGVGFLNDVVCFACAKTENPDEATYKAAAHEVRQLVLEQDKSRPSVYENEKRWPRIQSWYNECRVKCQMDAKPKIDDLEYYLYLRKQKMLTTEQAVKKMAEAGSLGAVLDTEYQKYLSVRYQTNTGKQTKAATIPMWKLKLGMYRNVLVLLNTEGKSRPLVSRLELVNCLNAFKNEFYDEISVKRQQNPNYQVDKDWYDAMNKQFDQISSTLNGVSRCESFEGEQNRRIRLARDYNK